MGALDGQAALVTGGNLAIGVVIHHAVWQPARLVWRHLRREAPA